MSPELPPERQEELLGLFLDELRRAWAAARAAGADPAALRGIVAERRRRLRSGADDDGEDGVDDPPDLGRLGE